MSIAALFDELSTEGAAFWLENGEIRFRAPAGVMTKERVAIIRRDKAEAIRHLMALESAAGMAPGGAQGAATAASGTPLSFAQERLWLVERMLDLGAAYNMPGSVHLAGPLNVDALERAFQEIVRRHDVLRTRFVLQGDEPRQVIDQNVGIALQRIDLSGVPPAQRAEHARRLAADKAREPFRLGDDQLLRLFLFALGEQEHILLISMHHAISDGWSIAVLVRELVVLYGAYVAGQASPLPPLQAQYRDYAVWQRKRLSKEFLQEHVDYWQRQLQDCPEATELPLDHARPAMPSFRGDEVVFEIPAEVCAGLRALVEKEGTTPFVALLAALNVLLQRWSGQSDLVIGTPVAGRTHRYTEDLIGLFVNMLPMRSQVRADQPFNEFLRTVADTTLAAYAHQEVPFERMVDLAKSQRTLARQPLFQVGLVLENMPQATLKLPGLTLQEQRICTHSAKFDLTFALREAGGKLQGYAEFATDLYERATIERLVGNFQVLLKSIVADPGCMVSRLPLLTADDLELQLVRWNDTRKDYPKCCIHELVAAQVARTPHHVALIHNGIDVSYAQLDARANQLAHYLQSVNVGPGAIVGVCLERSPDMLAAMLAVLKSGAAYVPLDPNYPNERLHYMLDDAGAAHVLTCSALRSKLPAIDGLLCLDEQAQAIDAQPRHAPAGDVSPESMAYVIYTSGSTGRPKGIELTHRGGVAFLSWAIGHYDAEDMAILVAATSICFDVSFFELYAPLCRGTTILLAANPVDLPPEAARATMLSAVPSAMTELLRGGAIPPSIRAANIAGEALPVSLVNEMYERTNVRKIFNLYGPSEDTTYSTVAMVPPGAKKALIGRPISNTQLYVLSGDQQLLPVGAVGELYIAGDGLARGYLGKPEMTAQRFLPNPFNPGTRMYKTGDLVRYLPDGSLDYLGRIDHQVKVRGFRIELGEIEAVLEQHPGVQQSVVLLRDDERGDKRIVAYVVSTAPVSAQELQQHLRQALPDYMIPSAFVMLDAMPLNPNGKIDRADLPQPDSWGKSQAEYVAPRTPVEQTLAAVWKEILQVERVGIHDNFFELGGHSLMAVKLVNALTTRLGRHIPISSFMGAPTIAELAVALSPEGASDDAGSIVTLQRAATGTPLFLIHAVGGHLLGYRDLVQALGHAGPVYGIQRPEIAAREAPRFLPIADLADQYLEQILRVQEHGDYLLCGWSFGGIVSLRIAERLQAMGRQVRYVGLIDCVLPLAEVDRLRPAGLEKWAGRGVREGLPEMPVDVVALAEQVVILNDVDNVARQSDSVDSFFHDLYLANFWAVCTYTPSVRVPNVHIYCASESKKRPEFDASLAYLSDLNAVAGAEFFEGDHYSILKAPRARALARAVGADIAAAHAQALRPVSANSGLATAEQTEIAAEQTGR